MLDTPMRCSAMADALDESMIGTADHRVRWLLVEDRSAWGEKAVREVLGAELEDAAKERGMRLLLIRRREGDPAADAERRAFLVDTAAGAMAARSIRDAVELWGLLDAPIAGFGEPVADPMFLVCTNGRRDACCALRGRALVASLAGAHGERTWECTHLGGHRFAGNLVCLPDGIIYGRVAPADGPRIVDAYLAGRLEPGNLRGRSSWPVPAQVAERSLRLRLGLDALDDLRLLSVDGDDAHASVTIAAPDGIERMELRAERLSPARAISCNADRLESPLHWRVIGPTE